MKYRCKASGKVYSEDEMAKMRVMKGYNADQYEQKDEDEDEDDQEKSDLTEDELRKSVQQLEDLVASGDRKSQLLEKAQNGDLEDDERDELYRILGGADDEGFASEVVKGLQPDADDGLAKALDISDYLNAQHRGLVEAMEAMAGELEKGSSRQHDFNLVLAKGLIDQSKLVLETHGLIKGISERLGLIERQPARPPKSQLTKGDVARREIAGQPEGQNNQLLKGEVANVLSGWIQEGRQTSGSGESLLVASSKFEQFNTLSPALAAEVKQALEAKRTAA